MKDEIKILKYKRIEAEENINILKCLYESKVIDEKEKLLGQDKCIKFKSLWNQIHQIYRAFKNSLVF